MEPRLLCYDRQHLWAALICDIIMQSWYMLIAHNTASLGCASDRQHRSLPESQLWHIVQNT